MPIFIWVNGLSFLHFLFCIFSEMIDIKVISSKEYDKMKKENEVIIFYGFHKCPFGRCLIGILGKRICHVSFVNDLDSVNLNNLQSQWPGSVLMNNEKLTVDVAKNIFESDTELFKVLLKGTEFERKVWQALVEIPKGETISYEDVALAAGHVKAVRAAANAVAKNSVAYLVPCHRVIKKDGSLHKYQWGPDIKRQILEFEKHHN